MLGVEDLEDFEDMEEMEEGTHATEYDPEWVFEINQSSMPATSEEHRQGRKAALKDNLLELI
jgi:hypothetical protein